MRRFTIDRRRATTKSPASAANLRFRTDARAYAEIELEWDSGPYLAFQLEPELTGDIEVNNGRKRSGLICEAGSGASYLLCGLDSCDRGIVSLY